jgi:4-hydroxy-3-polyprenylbenzoate decarboxylase
MPVAAVIGADPCSHFAAALKFGVGVSEVDYAGALLQEPVELVKCETIDLYVPAHAEMVLEGELLPDVTMKEGPFDEWTGHQSTLGESPVFRVKAITYRNNPILTVALVNLSDQECTVIGMVNEMAMETFLRERGIPVADLHAPEAMNGACLVVAVRRTGSANIAYQVAEAAHTYHGRGRPHMIIVVDDDVDVYNITEVLHALAMRCNPGKGIKINDHAVADHLLPWLTEEERKHFRGSTVVFDCTWPPERVEARDVPPRISFRESFPEEVQRRVSRIWQNIARGDKQEKRL